jgi:hypothetical protein
MLTHLKSESILQRVTNGCYAWNKETFQDAYGIDKKIILLLRLMWFTLLRPNGLPRLSLPLSIGVDSSNFVVVVSTLLYSISSRYRVRQWMEEMRH